jgi:hypothetical protein
VSEDVIDAFVGDAVGKDDVDAENRLFAADVFRSLVGVEDDRDGIVRMAFVDQSEQAFAVSLQLAAFDTGRHSDGVKEVVAINEKASGHRVVE